MQGKHLFEYAVVRIVPQVEQEEFLNAGIILYCSAQKFLKCRIVIDEPRLRVFSNNLDLGLVRDHIQSFERICSGGKDSGPIGQLTLAERFRWLTATRSTIIQTSKVHPGLCADAEDKLKELFDKLSRT
ncbi:MAG TPA: DUF3037 domain-containing protein [Cyclobacteriaceae bacterium]|nr:DUF3037 domain-containing protein [Cyclobacteriaceae bacterium]